jgi:hypothetical protein
MTITITPTHNEARLAGTLTFLDTGTANARMRLYGGTRPALATDAPGTAMLVEIELTKPAGTVAANALTLTQVEDGLIAATGVAVWGRFVNGNGDAAFDADVDNGSNNGEIVMATTQLYAGGDAKLVSCVLG